MKKIYTAFGVILMIFFTSCNYLDIVPDERVTQDKLYETPQQVKNFLYSCYGYLPSNREICNNAYWMLTGGETSFYRKEWFSYFNEGAYSPTYLHMTYETWGPVWQGIRQCYLFLSFIDKAENMVDTDIIQYKAEAKFLIAYYHFISLRSYGPTIIIDHLYDSSNSIDKFPGRSSYDEVVTFINKELDEAINEGLADSFEGDDYGRATKFAALALKSRLYLYAASPLFNGNSEMYSNFVDNDGNNLISQSFDIKKWETSAQVTKDAITQLETYGFKLYSDEEAGTPDANKPGIPNKAQRRIRYSTMDYSDNPEVIWADARTEDMYGLQNRSAPRQTIQIVYGGAGGIAPTLPTVEMFYTDKGLPISADKTFDYNGRYNIAELPVNYDGNNYSSQSNGTTMKLHINREPRFYAWIGFHNGFTEISRYNGVTTGGGDYAKKAIVLKMRNSDVHGRQNKSLYYSVTGYLNKKWVHPAYQSGPVKYPFVLFRMAELYLNYAEALVELNKLDEAKVYIDKVRERAGIPSVDDAWNNFSNNPGYQNTQEGLREIVRQERSIEFYLEGHKFFDIRRWKIAEQYLGIPDIGLNVSGNTDEEFFRVTDVPLTRAFHKGQYLMPIDANEINKDPKLVQNPFYE